MEKKFERVEEDVIKTSSNHKLYRIRALVDFDDVKAGDLGGYVGSQVYLSHSGNAWVYEGAKVFDGSIKGNAKVRDNATVNGGDVSDDAVICDNAKVSRSRISGTAKISGNSVVRCCRIKDVEINDQELKRQIILH